MGQQQVFTGQVSVKGALTANDGLIVKTSGVALTDATNDLKFSATAAGKKITLNSITKTSTSSSNIGFQSKPGQGASMANDVIGGEISPRISDTFALTGSGSIIGLHVDAYLKGTTGDIAGHVRGMQIELVDDGGSSRTVTGDCVGLRFRSNISYTVTGDHVPILVEADEGTTGWEFLLKLPDDEVIASDAAVSSATNAGFLKIKVGSATRYINLFSGTPA